MNIIDTNGRFFNTARKTRSISAAPVAKIVNSLLIPHILLNTLEGPAPVGIDNYICTGFVGEPWQQTEAKLLGSYTRGKALGNGWRQYNPKPSKFVEVWYAEEDGYIQGMWGSTIDGVERLQLVKIGDVICRDIDNRADQWRVAGAIFDVTYSII